MQRFYVFRLTSIFVRACFPLFFLFIGFVRDLAEFWVVVDFGVFSLDAPHFSGVVEGVGAVGGGAGFSAGSVF